MKIKNWHILLFCSVLVILFSFVLFGIVGLRASAGIILIYFTPLYLIFDNFSISFGEKVIFSFFIGIILVPALAYWPGRFMSLTMSIFLVAIIIAIVGVLVKHLKKSSVQVKN